jgi:LPXTG-motif cell wall-anchored protein
VSELLPQTGAGWGAFVSAGSCVMAVLGMLVLAARSCWHRLDDRRRRARRLA